MAIAAAVAGWANRVERRSSVGSEGFRAASKGSRYNSTGSGGFRAVSKGFGAVGEGCRGRYSG